MTTHVGNEGVIKLGANTIAEVVNFTLNTHAELAEDTAKGDDWRTYKAGFKSWDGSLTCHFNEEDTTGQNLLTEGADATLDLYPGGESSGMFHFSGAAIVEEVTIESPEDGIASYAVTFQGNGTLTRAAVA